MNENDRDNEELPRAIIERLRARDRNVAFLTPRVDAALERSAAEHFAGRAGPVRRSTRWAIPAAVAAALLAAVVIFRFDGGFEPEPATVLLADDIDNSGQVDILDAFALARAHVAAGDINPAEQRDVAMLAARVVALAPPANARQPERVL